MSPALCGAIEGTHVRVQKGGGGGYLYARHVSPNGPTSAADLAAAG